MMTWWSSIRSMLACAVAVIVTCNFIAGVRGKMIRLNWTSEGVRNYTSTPLQTELGDVLELDCKGNVSNLYIQDELIQYDSCNASAGSGVFRFNGFCFPGNSLITFTLTENSQNIQNTVNNQRYYLTSYSNGDLGSSGENGPTSGGQCEDGLKMIIVVGEVPGTSGPGGNSGGNPDPHDPGPSGQGLSTSNRSGGSNATLYIIIGAAAVIVATLVAAVIIVIVALKAHIRKTRIGRSDTNMIVISSSLCHDISSHENASGNGEMLPSGSFHDEFESDNTEIMEMNPIVYNVPREPQGH